MELAHAKNIAETLQFFGTKESQGLTPTQVKEAQEKYGPNGKFCPFLKKWRIWLLNFRVVIHYSDASWARVWGEGEDGMCELGEWVANWYFALVPLQTFYCSF